MNKTIHSWNFLLKGTFHMSVLYVTTNTVYNSIIVDISSASTTRFQGRVLKALTVSNDAVITILTSDTMDATRARICRIESTVLTESILPW